MKRKKQQMGCCIKKCLNTKVITHILLAFCFCVLLFAPTMTGLAYEETPGVVIADSAKIRDKADTSGEVIGSVSANKTISICGEETGSDGMVWYQVYVNASTKGYIRSDLVKKEGSSSNTSQTTTSSESSSPQETSVTAMDSQAGKVITDNVNIRSAASKTANVIASAKKGLSVTVTGKANGTDGKTWYQVTFTYENKEMIGFIRSDLVTFGEVESDASVTEITGTVSGQEGDENMEEEMNETEAQETEAQETEENEEQDTAEESEANTSVASTEVILLNTEEEPYVMPGFEQVVLNWKEKQITAWKNGDFYIFRAQVNGNEGWYLYDQPENVYERYVYETETATVPKSGSTGNTILLVTLGIIIALLIGVIVVMFLKMRDIGGHGWDDDDDDDEDYNDDEDYGEEEYPDEEEEEIIRGRSVTRKAEKVPVRSTRSNPSMEQQGRRPVYEDDMPVRTRHPEGAPQGRPVNRDNAANRAAANAEMQQRRPAEGQRPVRRPEGAPQGRPVRRTDAQGRPINPQGRPAMAPQGRPVEGQRPVRRPEGAPQGRPKNYDQPREGGNRRPTSQTGSVRTRRVQPQQKEQDDIEFIDI